jgi:hypothetical protein
MGDDWSPCQELADRARTAGLDGLLAPSSALPGETTLVVFAHALANVTAEHSRVQRRPIRMLDVLTRLRLPDAAVEEIGRLYAALVALGRRLRRRRRFDLGARAQELVDDPPGNHDAPADADRLDLAHPNAGVRLAAGDAEHQRHLGDAAREPRPVRFHSPIIHIEFPVTFPVWFPNRPLQERNLPGRPLNVTDVVDPVPDLRHSDLEHAQPDSRQLFRLRPPKPPTATSKTTQHAIPDLLPK